MTKPSALDMPLAREAFAVAGKGESGHGHGGAAGRPPGTIFERAQRAALLAGDTATVERGKPAGAEGAKEGKGKGRDKGKAKPADPNQRSLVSFVGSSAAKAVEENAREDPVPAKWCFPLPRSEDIEECLPPLPLVLSHSLTRSIALSRSLARSLSLLSLSLATTGTRCGAKARRAWK